MVHVFYHQINIVLMEFFANNDHLCFKLIPVDLAITITIKGTELRLQLLRNLNLVLLLHAGHQVAELFEV